MPISGVFATELDLIYVDLDNILGAYVSEPGETPFIAINSLLKDKQEPTANLVYNALKSFHESLPDVYRLFPITKFFEDLPQETSARSWQFNIPYGQGYKVKGR